MDADRVYAENIDPVCLVCLVYLHVQTGNAVEIYRSRLMAL